MTGWPPHMSTNITKDMTSASSVVATGLSVDILLILWYRHNKQTHSQEAHSSTLHENVSTPAPSHHVCSLHPLGHRHWFVPFSCLFVFHEPGRKGRAETRRKPGETETISSFPFYPAVRLLIKWESVLMKAHSLDVQAISLVQWGQEHKP